MFRTVRREVKSSKTFGSFLYDIATATCSPVLKRVRCARAPGSYAAWDPVYRVPRHIRSKSSDLCMYACGHICTRSQICRGPLHVCREVGCFCMFHHPCSSNLQLTLVYQCSGLQDHICILLAHFLLRMQFEHAVWCSG